MNRKYLKFIAIITTLILSEFTAKADTSPFDNIRPLATAGFDILKEQGDSLKALTLLTEALMRGQDWAESEEEISLMGTIVAQTISLRANLKKEPFQRLMLELMVGSQISMVNRDKNTYGGRPEKLPEIKESSTDLTDDSIATSIRKVVDLMAANKLKEGEKLLLSLYSHTWTNGKNSRWRHLVANKLGMLYLKLGTHENAIDILRQNKLDMDSQLSKDQRPNEDYCETLFYLAHAYREDETRIIWKCFLETANEIALRYHLKIDNIIGDFNKVFLSDNNIQKDENEIENFIRENDRNLSFLTEKQREKRWEKLKGRWTDIKNSLIDSTGKITDINTCLNAFQYEKQIMLRSAAKTIEALLEAKDEEAVLLTDSLIKTRSKLVSCTSYSEPKLTAEYEQIQKTLLHHHVMNDFENHLFKMVTTQEIADKLKGNETFVDFGTLDAEDGEQYFAIIVSPRTPKGKIIPLCSVKEFETFMKNTENIEARQMVDLRYGSDFLQERIWGPICRVGLLNEKIYYSPCGMLGLIMPEAIKHNGKYLGEDFEFHILSSIEELENAHAGKYYMPPKIYSFCAIDYYCERLALIANARMYGASRPVMPDILERDSDIRTAFSDPRSIPPLHHPEDFEWLQSLCDSKEVPVLIPTGFNASEHALKYLSGLYVGTLNIVTHAFSMPKSLNSLEKPYFSSINMKTRYNDNLEIEFLPLYRTGFMLSGAERAWCERNKISGIEDGIVNGEELAALDLHGVDLLTLIACDTGNGDIDPEEGIMGLRRALKLAGCKTLVTTAWNLDKEAGDAYLQEFYSNLLSGSGIEAAHRRAQLELLKRFDNPYYWAVFQLID